jgi:hypothetical protein
MKRQPTSRLRVRRTPSKHEVLVASERGALVSVTYWVDSVAVAMIRLKM